MAKAGSWTPTLPMVPEIKLEVCKIVSAFSIPSIPGNSSNLSRHDNLRNPKIVIGFRACLLLFSDLDRIVDVFEHLEGLNISQLLALGGSNQFSSLLSFLSFDCGPLIDLVFFLWSSIGSKSSSRPTISISSPHLEGLFDDARVDRELISLSGDAIKLTSGVAEAALLSKAIPITVILYFLFHLLFFFIKVSWSLSSLASMFGDKWKLSCLNKFMLT